MGCCVEFTGFARDCEPAKGGIRKIWIACWDAVQTPTVANKMITALGSSTAADWKEFEFEKNTGNFTSTALDTDSGLQGWQTEIVLQFERLGTAKSIEIDALVRSDIAVVVLDSNGQYWYFGFDEYVRISAGTGETGTAKADFNGYNITLLDESDELPYELTQTAINQLLGVTNP